MGSACWWWTTSRPCVICCACISPPEDTACGKRRAASRPCRRLRRRGPTSSLWISACPAWMVRLGNNRVLLTPTEYDLLRVLVQHAGKVLTHRQLVREVWGGMCYEDSLHLVRVNVSNLRRKLETDPAHPRYILTEPGVGYRLDNEPAPDRVPFQVTSAAAAYDGLPRLPVQ